MTTVRDTDMSAVYSAENIVTSMMDMPDADTIPVKFHGSFLPPIEQDRKFADLASVQRFVEILHATNWGWGADAGVPPANVRSRKGDRKAHWEAPATIAIPFGRNGRWACREMVVLHEYAHHVSYHLYGEANHGDAFRKVHADLVRNAVGPVAGLLLTSFYDGV